MMVDWLVTTWGGPGSVGTILNRHHPPLVLASRYDAGAPTGSAVKRGNMPFKLPKASHWARGPRQDEDFSMSFHLDVYEQVPDLYVPVFPMPTIRPKMVGPRGAKVPTESEQYASGNARLNMERAAAMHAPLCFRGGQDIQDLLLDKSLPLSEPGRFADAPPGSELSARCWAPDDAAVFGPAKKLSPMSHGAAWFHAGVEFGRLKDWATLADLYPAPPSITLLFNNETSPQLMVTPVNDLRLFDRRFDRDDIEDPLERAEHILDGYKRCFGEFFRGLKSQLSPAWAEVIETAGYWNLEHIPIMKGGAKQALWEAGERGSVALQHYNLASLEVYDWGHRNTLRDVLPVMSEDARKGRAFGCRYEASVWDDIDGKPALQADPAQPVRYRAWTTLALWGLRAEVLRGYRNHATDRADLEDDFWTAIIGPVREVHKDPVLRHFWQNGSWAELGVATNDAAIMEVYVHEDTRDEACLVYRFEDGRGVWEVEYGGHGLTLDEAAKVLGLVDEPEPEDEDMVEELRARITELETALGDAEQRLGEIEGERDALRLGLEESERMLTVVEDRVTQLIDGMQALIDG